jgi:mono/diheme cytochrome c family protein
MRNSKSSPASAALWILSLLLAAAPSVSATSPSANQSFADFDHDIRPIFEKTCLRCHGPERPKSHFRLDNRESALKGGNDCVDILPGHGAESPLLKRVASTNEDTQMPPPGKGERLTEAQIGQVQAWIDQGADWGATNSRTPLRLELAPQFVWMGVHGDKGGFREIEGIKDGYFGGVEHFLFQDQINPAEKFSTEGHYLSAGQDAMLRLNLTKNDVGFIHAGVEQWDHYSDNFGWHDSAVTPSGLPSKGDLTLNEGRAWVDFGLAPARGPQIVLGYEEQFRVGNESTLDWGPLGGKNIAPSMEAVDEHTHIVKLDVSGDWAGWQVEDNARVEIHRQDNQDDESARAGSTFKTQEKYDDVQGMNTLTLGRMVRDWWSASLSYYSARLEGSDALNQSGSPPMGQYWQSPQVTLATASEILSASSLFRPLPSLSLGLDTQFEWTHEAGFGEVDNAFGFAGPILAPPPLENSDLEEFKSMQNLELRFTRIPWTVLFADARFEQDSYTLLEQGNINNTNSPFAAKIDANNTQYDARTGFTTSPWTWFSLNSQYRFYASDTSYGPSVDSTPPTSYPGFILGRGIKSDQVESKLTLRMARWLRTTLIYKIESTGYSAMDAASPSISPGGALQSGKYLARTYGLSAALAPMKRLSLTSALTYSDSRTWTFANNDSSVVPYQGSLWMITESAAYALNQSTDFSASYSFAQADYAENNGVAGIPLGMNYTRHTAGFGVAKHFTPRVSAALRYNFYAYAEPSSGGLTDYTAQGIFVTLTYKMP